MIRNRKKTLTIAQVKERHMFRKLIKEELENSFDGLKASALRSDKLYLKKELANFNTLAESLFVTTKVQEACKKMIKIKEAASNVILTETDDDYDKKTLQGNIKIMENIVSNIEKSITELRRIEIKIEDGFDTFGKIVEKYFKID